MTTDHPVSDHHGQLCGDRHGRVRAGRLGRYHVTCDDCEARRGSHLVRTVDGYANRAVVLGEYSLAS